MGLEFQNVYHAYGRNKVVHDVSFSAENGEITCLLGASGCGKTTVLQIAAGILDVQEGQLLLNASVLARPGLNPPPEKRSVGLVFQDGALFPHLSVAQNIGFGIRDKAHRSERVKDLLDKIGMTGFEDRFPHTLSGGQQQRVAFARAIAPSPSLLLLDEPFANVDIQLRKNLRALVRNILKHESCPAILVTHDPNEALDVADKIVVLDAGRVVQSGATETLYDFPATASVEALLGGGQTYTATLTATHLRTPFGNWPKSVIAKHQHKSNTLPLGQIDFAIRTEDIKLVQSRAKSALKVLDMTCIGPHVRATLVAPETGELIFAHLPRNTHIHTGQSVRIRPRTASVFVFAKT